ncbi:MAG: hypothetical protein JNM98_03685 [Rhodocyclaceae bacterium]|nr:hypothetical protein [Rhodocyclaceae bacterium]
MTRHTLLPGACAGLFAAILVSLAAAQTTDPFAAGRDWAAGKSQDVGAAVTDTTARGNMPEYHDAAGASQFFNGGQGAPIQPGQARRDFCATPGGPLGDRDKYDCDAVNLMQGVANARPAVQINRHTDPLINNPNLNAARTAPGSYIGIAPSVGGQSCVTRTVTEPGPAHVETCSTQFSFESATCQKSLSVTVTTSPSCEVAQPITSGTVSPAVDPRPRNQYYAAPMCTFGTGTTFPLRLGSYTNPGRCGAPTFTRSFDFSVVDQEPVYLGWDRVGFDIYDNRCVESYFYLQRHGCQGTRCAADVFFSERWSHPWNIADPFADTFASTGRAPSFQALDFPTSYVCSGGGLAGSAGAYVTGFGAPLDARACYAHAAASAPGAIAVYAQTQVDYGDGGTGVEQSFLGYFTRTGEAPGQIRSVAPWVRSISLAFELPHNVVHTADAWDDGCATYEARE